MSSCGWCKGSGIRYVLGSNTTGTTPRIFCDCPAGEAKRLKAERDRLSERQSNFPTPAPTSILPPMPPKRETSLVRDLETLAELHNRGLLTKAEFDAAKKRLLES